MKFVNLKMKDYFAILDLKRCATEQEIDNA